jgi:hypothetical protein
MSASSTPPNDPTSTDADDVLAAYTAVEVGERPGELDEPSSPASDTDVAPPG